MRISALEEYGLRCLLALIREGYDKQLSISDIARQEGLSIPYASKLLSILRKGKLVEAIRGRGGGFRIARPPDQINLLEVITVLGGPLIEPGHCARFSGQKDECVHAGNCSVKFVFSDLANYVGNYLSNTTLVDILNGDFLDKLSKIKSQLEVNDTSASDNLSNQSTSKPVFNQIDKQKGI